MFDDAALKLRNILKSITTFIMFITGSVGIMVAVWLSQIMSYDGGGWVLFIGLLVTVVVMVLEWVQSLLLVAFCDMMVDVKYIKGLMSSADKDVYVEEAEDSNRKLEEKDTNLNESDAYNEEWFCVRCGNSNSPAALRCKCGASKPGINLW